MTTMLGKKVSRIMIAGLRIAHLNLTRSYNAFIAILGVIPVAYLFYILMNANQKSQSIVEVLNASPYATVMLIVALLDVICGYVMWKFKEIILGYRKVYQYVLISLTVIQLLLGNALLAVVGVGCLCFSGQVESKRFTKMNQVYIALWLVGFLYLFCVMVIFKLIIH